jgi:protein-S-isoprenylcysteine O-methyltransferase Ste14
MNLALARAELGTRVLPRLRMPSRQRVGELSSKVIIVTLFSSMAMRLAEDSARTGHVTGILMLASEAMVVALTLVRRSAGTVDRTWRARVLTAFSTFGPPLVKPASFAGIAPEGVTVIIAAIGMIVVVCGKASLGRSFGLVPANRGVVSTGMYRFVRHPIYLGYLITHAGFVIANPLNWNWAVLIAADVALMSRAVLEEKTLAKDDAYREYMRRTPWRVVPGLF